MIDVLFMAVALTAADFLEPPMAYRPGTMRHNRFEGYREKLPALMEDGFGGYVANVGPGDVNHREKGIYLELREDLDSMAEMAEFSRQRGYSVWIYDEDGYPSLSAADIVLKEHPELEQTAWLFAFADVGPDEEARLEVPPGRFCLALAAELDDRGALTGTFADISDAVRNERPLCKPFERMDMRPYDAAGRPELGLAKSRDEIRTGPLVWKVPQGPRRRVYVVTEDYIFEATHPGTKGSRDSRKYRYPNPLSREAVDRFIDVTHARYEKSIGSPIGKWITGFFTDEPGMMANWETKMPYYCLPSHPELRERYRRRTGGRDLVRDIPYLMHASAETAVSQRLREAFWGEAGEQLVSNFFGRVTSWCDARATLSGGHLMGEEDFAYHVSNYGDFFKCLKAFSCPSVDILYTCPESVPYLSALYAGSARELCGRVKTLAEVSSTEVRRQPSYVCTEDEMQGMYNRLLWAGINTFASYHRWHLYAPEARRRINLRTARTAALLLKGGHSTAEIALFYPARDAMRLYVPQSKVGYEAGSPLARLQDAFSGTARALYESGRSFLIVDEETIEKAYCADDALVFGDLRFKAVVMPGVQTLSPLAKARLMEFKQDGGIVLRQTGEAIVTELDKRLDRQIRFQSATGEGAGSLRIATRRDDGRDVYFVANDADERWQGRIGIRGNPRNVRVWDPEDGSVKRAKVDESGLFELSLPAYRGILLTVGDEIPETVADGQWRKRLCARHRLYERALSLAKRDKLLEAELEEFRRSFREDVETHRLDPRNSAVSSRRMNVRDFGAKGDGIADETPAFAAASAAIRKLQGEPVVLDIPPGDYRFRTEVLPVLGKPVQVDFSGLTNCWLRGAGPEKTEFVFCVYGRSGVSLNKSENTTLEGVSCRYLENPFSQCEILSFDPEEMSAEVRWNKRTLRPDDPRFRLSTNPLVCGVYDAVGRKIVDEGGTELFYTRRAESLGGDRYRLQFDRRAADAVRPESLKGAIVALPDRDNGLQGLNTFLSSHCTCANVWFRNARSSTITGYGARYFTMANCRVLPMPGLVFSANADSGYCERGATIMDCDFGWNNDDGANCFGTGVQVVERTGSRAVRTHPFLIPPKPGDVIKLVCALDGRFLADMTVAAVVGDVLEFCEDLPGELVTEKECGVMSATDRRNVSLGLGRVRAAADIAYAPVSRGVGFVFANNRIHDLRGNGVNVQASHAVVSGNSFENLAQGVKLSGLNNWFEGLPPSDVVIEKNSFVNCRRGVSSVYTDVNAGSAAIKAISDVLLSDNRFESVEKEYDFLNAEVTWK